MPDQILWDNGTAILWDNLTSYALWDDSGGTAVTGTIAVTYADFVSSLSGTALGADVTGSINTTYADFVSSLTGTSMFFIASPGRIDPNSTGNVVTLIGFGAGWTPGTPGSPIFTLSSTGTGASITTQVVNSATSATLTINAGTAGTITITDPSTGKTATISVSFSTGANPTFFGITLDTVRSPSGNPRKFNIGL